MQKNQAEKFNVLCFFSRMQSLGKNIGVDRFISIHVHCILKDVPNKGKKATKYLIPVHKDNANTKITKPTLSLPKWANNRIHQTLSIIKGVFL